MSTKCGSHVVDVHESDARLAYDKRVSGWRNYPICNVWLKVDNAGAGKIEVVSPSRNNWVRLNSFVTVFLEEGEERFPHLPKTVTPAGRRVPYESLSRATFWSCLPTSFLVWVLGPKINGTGWAQFSHVSNLIEEGDVILFLWKALQVVSSNEGSNCSIQKLKFKETFKQLRKTALKKRSHQLSNKGISLFALCILSINYGSAAGAAIEIAFYLFLLVCVDFVVAVLVWALHTLSPIHPFWLTSSVKSVF